MPELGSPSQTILFIFDSQGLSSLSQGHYCQLAGCVRPEGLPFRKQLGPFTSVHLGLSEEHPFVGRIFCGGRKWIPIQKYTGSPGSWKALTFFITAWV